MEIAQLALFHRIVRRTGIGLLVRIVHPTGIVPSAMEIAQHVLFHRIVPLVRIVHPTGIAPLARSVRLTGIVPRDLPSGSDLPGK